MGNSLSPSTDDSFDEDQLAYLVRFDECLRLGRIPTDPPDGLTDAQLAELTRAATCLAELEELIPRYRARQAEDLAHGIPDRVGGFEIREVLGSGGFAVVYKAYDRVLDRMVALKIPRPHVLASPELRKRFVREALVAAQLDHSQIVPIYEAGEDGDLPYIAYAYCEGPTLAAWLKERQEPLPPGQAVQLMIQLAEAVQYSHERGVLHRDIKPANVLLFPLSSPPDPLFPYLPRVSDFGLAKLIESTLEDSVANFLLGTPQYMCPEQAEGQTEIGVACDVYSLGGVLYFMLTGRPPFLAAGLAEMLTQVIEREPIAPVELNPAVDRDLNTICLKCLEKTAARRYGSAQALADDLRRYVAREPIEARPASLTHHAWRWARRKPLTSGLLAGIVTLVGVLLTSILWHQGWLAKLQRQLEQQNAELTVIVSRLNEALRSAQQQRENAESNEDRVRQLLYAADVQLAATEWRQDNPRVAARRLAERMLPEERDVSCEFSWRYLYGQVTAPSQLISNARQAIWCATFSPDGSWCAVGGNRGRVQLFEVNRGYREVRTWETGQREVNGVAFSPAGDLLATAGDDGRVGLWNVRTGEHVRWLDVFSKRLVYGIAFTEGGKRLVACGHSPDLSVWDVATGQRVATIATPHRNAIESLAISPDGRRIATAGDDGTASVFRLGEEQPEFILRGHTKPVMVVQFSSDGKWLVTAGHDGMVRAHDATTGRLLRTYFRRDGIDSLAIHASGKVACCDRGGVITWLESLGALPSDQATEENVVPWPAWRTWAVSGARINGLAFTPNGDELLSGSFEGELRRWRPSPTQLFQTLPAIAEEKEPASKALAAAPEPHIIFRAGVQGLEAWDVLEQRRVAALLGDVRIHACRCLPERQILLVGDSAGRIGIVPLHGTADAALRVPEWIVVFENSPVRRISSSMSGSRVVALSNADELAFVDLPSKRVEKRLTQRSACAMSPDGKWLVTARHITNDIEVLATQTAEVVASHPAHESTVFHLTFSPDGRELLTTGGDRAAIVWDTNTWTRRVSLLGHRARVGIADYSSDGATIATGDDSGIIKLWQAATGQELLELPRFQHEVATLAFSRDGENLFATTTDYKVHCFSAPCRSKLPDVKRFSLDRDDRVRD